MRMLTGGLMVLLVATAATVRAQDGIPSQARLSKLGLSGMQVVDDDTGMQVRGASIAVVGGQFMASTGGNGFGIWGFPLFGIPALGIGGSAAFQHATAIDGESPFLKDQAVAAILTLDANTGAPGPVIVESSIAVNGSVAISRSTVSGGAFAVAGANILGAAANNSGKGGGGYGGRR